LDRKKECISRPNMWARKGWHKRVVFSGSKDKKGRVFVKTPGNLCQEDLLKNKYGKVVSKRRHAFGKQMYEHIKPCCDARMEKARQLGLTGFVKAKKNGTYEERQLHTAMRLAAALEKAPQGQAEAVDAIRAALAQATPPSSGASSSGIPSAAVSQIQPFAPNTKVVLHGLTTIEGEKINDKTGIVLAYGVHQPGRYQIKLNEPVAGVTNAVGFDSPVVHVKPDNLIMIKP